MDALELLTADHNRVRGLAARFEEAEENADRATMADLATAILSELDVHTTIEEEIFYPAIRSLEGMSPLVAESLAEHHVVKMLETESEELPIGDEAWVARVKVMIENVEHHATEEETEMFPAVGAAMSRADLVTLADRMEAMKADLGAPTVATKEHLRVDELAALAQEQEIPGRSSMKREELLATVAPADPDH